VTEGLVHVDGERVLVVALLDGVDALVAHGGTEFEVAVTLAAAGDGVGLVVLPGDGLTVGPFGLGVEFVGDLEAVVADAVVEDVLLAGLVVALFVVARGVGHGRRDHPAHVALVALHVGHVVLVLVLTEGPDEVAAVLQVVAVGGVEVLGGELGGRLLVLGLVIVLGSAGAGHEDQCRGGSEVTPLPDTHGGFPSTGVSAGARGGTGPASSNLGGHQAPSCRSAKWQAAPWSPPLVGRICGSMFMHCSWSCAESVTNFWHLVRNLQPEGGFAGLGRSPSKTMWARPRSFSGSWTGMAESNAWV